MVVVGAASAGWPVGRWPSGTIAPSTYLATYLPLGLSGMTTATFASKVTWCFVVNGWCRGIFCGCKICAFDDLGHFGDYFRTCVTIPTYPDIQTLPNSLNPPNLLSLEDCILNLLAK